MGVQNELRNKMLQNNSTRGNYSPVTKTKGKQVRMLDPGHNNKKKTFYFYKSKIIYSLSCKFQLFDINKYLTSFYYTERTVYKIISQNN